MKIKRILAMLVCTALLVGVGCPAFAAGERYVDVPAAYWGAQWAEKAAVYGLMEGMGDGRFQPDGSVTWGQFLAILSRILGWNVPAATGGAEWYQPYVDTFVREGLVDAQTIQPKRDITRREMAALLVRALGLDWLSATAGTADQPFTDSRGDGYVNLAYHIGLITGEERGSGRVFRPQDGASRIEAAAMAVRFYERYTGKLDWLHGFYAFSSYSQIGFTDSMDAVSLGWGRMSFDPVTGPWVNTTATDGNEWAIPQGGGEATARFQQAGLGYNLCVFCAAGRKLTLADGRETNVLSAVILPEYRAQSVAALVDAAKGYSGLTVDFEGLSGEENRKNLSEFMALLREKLPQEQTLYMAVPPSDWYTGYDYRALGRVCDKIILMAHDYQWTSVPESYVGTHSTDTPVAPLNRVYQALCQITDRDTGVEDVSKIALAVSFGSAGLKVEEKEDILAEAVMYGPGMATLADRLRQTDAQVGWAEEYQSPYVFYHNEEGARYKVWYEDARSVTAKIELARLFGVKGLSLWRLGTVPNEPSAPYFDVWKAVLEQR